MTSAIQDRLTDGPLVPRPVSPSRRRRVRLALTLLVVVAATVVGYHHRRPILTRYALLFRVDDPAPSDAIVVLLGGPEIRPAKAAALYRAGLAGRVVLCTGTVPPLGQVREEVGSARIMTALGVPAGSITILPAVVTSTKHEADAVLAFARSEKMRRVTVVTTAFHTARSRWIFRRVFRGSGIEVRVAAADRADFDESNWFERDESQILYLTETLKVIYYRLTY